MKRLCCAIGLLLATGGTVLADEMDSLDVETTLSTVLRERPQERTSIWVEWALRKDPAVAERLRALREEFERARHNNKICLGGRGIVGKAASVCSESQFTVMILALQPHETISGNLGYFQEFVDDPLRTSLRQFVRALGLEPNKSVA